MSETNGHKHQLKAVGPNDRKMSAYVWTPEKTKAAIMLAQGYTHEDVAKEIGKNERTIYRWKDDIEFLMEVDRLSLMVGIASKAERLRLVQRVVRQKAGDIIKTDKDLLDWLKFAQSEQDGIKLDIAGLFAPLGQNEPSMAGEGSAGDRATKAA